MLHRKLTFITVLIGFLVKAANAEYIIPGQWHVVAGQGAYLGNFAYPGGSIGYQFVGGTHSISDVLSVMDMDVGQQAPLIENGAWAMETVPLGASAQIIKQYYDPTSFSAPAWCVVVDYPGVSFTGPTYYGASYLSIYARPATEVGYDPVSAAAAGVPYTPPATPSEPQSKSYGNPIDNPGQPSVGEPINVASGNVFDEITDYQTTGDNPLELKRYYNSLSSGVEYQGALGSHWRTNYDRALWLGNSASSHTVIGAQRADGQVIYFTYKNGVWITDSDVHLRLAQSGSAWVLSDTNGVTENYIASTIDPSKVILSSIAYLHGYSQTLSYDANGKITTVQDSYGRCLKFTFANNVLQQVTTPDGLIITYGYDATGRNANTLDRLRSVNFSTQPQSGLQYLYENQDLPYALTGVIDENGNRYTSWTYDAYGRGLTSQFGQGSLFTTITYNDSDGSRIVTNSLGQQEVYKFTILQNIPKVTEIDRVATSTTSAAKRLFTYDGNGYPASQTDWNGNLTTYVNDSLGRVQTIVEASGTKQARKTSIIYLGNIDFPTLITAPELKIGFTYDQTNNVLTKTETDTTQTTLPYVTNGQSKTWHYGWTSGLLTSVQSPRSDVTAKTTFAYDNSGALVKTTNALGQSIQVVSHTPGGLPLKAIDANGVTSQFTYDARLRLIRSTLTTANGNLTTQYALDAAGNLLKETLPDGSFLTNTYDTAHRLVGVTDPFKETVTFTLDPLGDRTKITISNAAGTILRQQTSAFDFLGRLIRNTGGAGQQTALAYDSNSNLVSVTDPLNRLSTRTFDALNRQTSVTFPGNGTATTTYDSLDRPLSVVNPFGGTTNYVNDGFGDVIEQTSPDSGTTVYTYDDNSNLTSKIDAAGAVADYAYDVLDRLTKIAYPSDVNENVICAYDEAGHGFGIGRLTTVEDAAGMLTKSYDERGNLTKEARVNNAIGTPASPSDAQVSLSPETGAAVAARFTTSYSYDAASRIAGITYPSGTALTYGRDAMGRVISVSVKAPTGTSAQMMLTGIAYAPFGPMMGATLYGGVKEVRSLDGDYRLVSLADTGLKTLQSLTYGYDAADNVLSIADAVTPQNSQKFAYDSLNRLTTATGAYGALGYTYDPVGNRLTQQLGTALTSYSYSSLSNRLTTITAGNTTQSVSYTPSGNINGFSSRNVVNGLAYNQAERLASVTSTGKTIANFTYDAFGRRFAKATSSGTVLFQYDPQGHLLEEAGTTGTANVDYLYLDDGRLIGTITPSNGAMFCVLSDRLGTPQLVVSSSQAKVWSATYQPFGQTTSASGTTTQNLRLPGQYADGETGFYQNGFRDYAPSLGRYLESDPAGLTGGLNTYTYTGDNPEGYVDPKGLWQLTIGGGFWGGAELTFGHNSSQWNVGFYFGVGEGAYASFDPWDHGYHTPGFVGGVRGQVEIGIKTNLDLESSIDMNGEMNASLNYTDPLGISYPVISTDSACSNKPTLGYGAGGFIGIGGTSYF